MLSHVVTAQIAVAGAVVGCLGAVGIYWAPDEPYKHWIVAAGTLRGLVNALLMTVFIQGRSSIGAALLVGALCGLPRNGGTGCVWFWLTFWMTCCWTG